MTRYALVCCLMASSLSSCANRSVDLDVIRTPQLRASDDPAVMAQIDEQVESLTVDSERLYWLGTGSLDSSEVDIPEDGLSALRSCRKDDCVSSLVTYDRIGATAYAVRDGQIYWAHTNPDPVEGPRSLMTCPTAGCPGAPTAMTIPDGVEVYALTADALYTGAFISGAPGNTYQVSRLKLPPDGTGPQKAFVTDPSQPRSLTFSKDYAYWLELGGSAALRRETLDGSNQIETLASDLSSWSEITVTTDYVYWGQGDLDGSIARCPLAGCTDSHAPEVVASPVRSPEALVIDGTHLYWQNYTNALGLAVSSCALEHCSVTEPLAHGVAGPDALAVDDRYVYTATTLQEQLPGSGWPGPFYLGWPNPTSEIRRIAK